MHPDRSVLRSLTRFAKHTRREAAILLAALALAVPQGAHAQDGSFPHDDFDALLRAHVRNGVPDYDAFERDPAFGRYLGRLAALARVGGRVYSLDDVEHRIIRPQFREPRIHFAVVCAATGCPPLRSEAYTGGALAAQLDDEARRFLTGSPAKNRVDVPGRRVALSRIFDWYKEDFGGSPAAVGRHVARFFPAGPERALLESGQFRLTYTDYDWRLNSRCAGQVCR